MLLSAVSVLVVVQSSSEIPEGLTNNPVYTEQRKLHLKLEATSGLKFTDTVLTFTAYFICSKCLPSTPTDCRIPARTLAHAVLQRHSKLLR